MSAVDDELIVERHGNVLVARLNRPEAGNAFTPSLSNRLGEVIVEAESDDGVRALVLTGTGDRAFCAGMDLAAFAAREDMRGSGAETIARMCRGEVAIPMIGAANATAVAGGLELLLGCDVVIASSKARFGLPEIKRGLFAAGGGTSLGRHIPLHVAMELLLTGDTIDAARAYELGLINAVVEPEAVLATAVQLAERIAQNAPLSLRATKELGRLAVSDPAGLADRFAHWQPVVFRSHDAREGAAAFVEKRSPVWRGR